MYPAVHAAKNPNKPAYIMARSGRTVTYRELDERSNQAAQLFYSMGLRRGDHIALCLENHEEFFCRLLGGPAQRALFHHHQLTAHRVGGGVHRR